MFSGPVILLQNTDIEGFNGNVRRYGSKGTHTETIEEFTTNILADIDRKSRPAQ